MIFYVSLIALTQYDTYLISSKFVRSSRNIEIEVVPTELKILVVCNRIKSNCSCFNQNRTELVPNAVVIVELKPNSFVAPEVVKNSVIATDLISNSVASTENIDKLGF